MQTPVMPKSMQALPKTASGIPVPWFVQGEDFRIVDDAKAAKSIRSKICFICGKPIKKGQVTFVGGAGSYSVLAWSEPPTHKECAEYAAQVCPFITDPYRTRRSEGLAVDNDPANPANPEVYFLVTCSDYMIKNIEGQTLLKTKRRWIVSVSAWKAGQQVTF